MEVIVHKVGELGQSGRSAAETLVGHALAENQQLVIQVRNLDARGNDSQSQDSQSQEEADGLPEWCNVYAELSDQQIANLEQAVSRRLDLRRGGT